MRDEPVSFFIRYLPFFAEKLQIQTKIQEKNAILILNDLHFERRNQRMSVSSISNSSDWWAYLNSLSTAKSSSSNTFSVSSAQSDSSTTKSTSSSKESETDTATLLAMLSSLSGGLQNIPTSSDSEASSEVQDFLDKVQAGTVTDSDLTAMQSTLNSLPPPPPESTSASSTSSSASDLQSAIASFLDKVKAGTVTDSDLTTMQAELASAQSSSDATADSEYAASQSAALQQLLSVASSAYENSYQTNSQPDGVWSI
jgi:hypothetical protein